MDNRAMSEAKPTADAKPAVCVFCGSSPGGDPRFAAAAKALGRGIAEMGHALVFGGGGLGLMGEVARAARTGGAPVEGILPAFLRHVEPPLAQGETTRIVDNLFVRKDVMIARAAAFVILPGGLGTYDEFFEVLTAAQLGVHAKPILLVNIAGYFDALEAMLRAAVDAGFARAEALALYQAVPDAETALAALRESLKP
jgi:uncharacterized protein (TIGR00730 family)